MTDWIVINKHEPHTVYPRWHPMRLVCKRGSHRPPWLEPLLGRAERRIAKGGHSLFDSCDLVIQCGTPILWEGCRNSEWATLIWRDVLARLAEGGKPILNLGGGACYPVERCPETLMGHPDETFIRLMLRTASATTVRDRIAKKLLNSLGYSTSHLCCPAILAAQTFVTPSEPTRRVLINYMRGGGHYDWDQTIDANAWEETMCIVVTTLRSQGWDPLVIAHNHTELTHASTLWPELPRVLPANSREYFTIARDAAFGVFNRLHACVAVAGLGVPSIAIGTDTRNQMVETLGLKVFYVKDATAVRVLAAIEELVHKREIESRRLLALHNTMLSHHIELLRPYLTTTV